MLRSVVSEAGYNNFLVNRYFTTASIPTYLIPSVTSTACNARSVTDIPHIWVDLYVCESPRAHNIGNLGTWCAAGSANWRKAGSAYATGAYNSVQERCDVAAGVYYVPPWNKVAVSFNMAVKAGIGHGVAPARFTIYRYAN